MKSCRQGISVLLPHLYAACLAALGLLSPQSEIGAAPIRTPQSLVIDLSASLLEDHTYSLRSTVTYSPTKLFSSIAINKPIRLAIHCGSEKLGEDVMFYNDALARKSFTKSVVIDEIELKCPSRMIVLMLENNGVELDLDAPGIQHEVQDGGISTAGLIRSLRAALPSKKVELIKAHSLLSSIAGSRASLHCLIQSYESDPMMEGVITELRGQYASLYGPFQSADLSCPAVSVLAEQVKECADPQALSLFCVVYARYNAIKSWYTDSLVELSARDIQLDGQEETLRNELHDLQEGIKHGIAASSAQIE